MAKIKNHTIWVEQYLDETGDFVCAEVKINASLQKLLNSFAVRSDKKNIVVGVNSYDRYLIKKVLTHSSNWAGVYEIFFTKEILDSKKIVLKYGSEYDLRRNFFDRIGYFDSIIKSMENLLKPQKIKIEFKVKEE